VDEVALAEEARALEPELTFASLTAARLAELTAERGCDLITALLYDRLLRSAEHGAFIAEVSRISPSGPRPVVRDKVLVVPPLQPGIPGLEAGDGLLVRSVAQRLGFAVAIARLSRTGLVTENAAVLQRLLEEEPFPVVVVSSGRGSADLRLALEEEPSLARKVRVWIQMGGLLRGSPLAAALLAGSLPSRLLLAGRLSLLRELSSAPGSLLARPFRVPKGLKVVNVLPLPLASHLSGDAAARHARLSAQGPNDGATPALDSLVPQGPVLPLWSAGHDLRAPETAALLYRVFLHLARRGALARDR